MTRGIEDSVLIVRFGDFRTFTGGTTASVEVYWVIYLIVPRTEENQEGRTLVKDEIVGRRSFPTRVYPSSLSRGSHMCREGRLIAINFQPTFHSLRH